MRASPWHAGNGDVVGEFTAAARARGVDAGLYLSPWDLHDRRYGQEVAYNEYYMAQLHELLTRSVPERACTCIHTSAARPAIADISLLHV